MKKFLLMMAFAMICSCAFAQFGQLDSYGAEKKSKKVSIQTLVDAEKAKRGIATSDEAGKKDITLVTASYTATFENFDKGAYGFDVEYLNPKHVVGGTFGFHTTAGILSPATFEITPGLTFGTSVAKNKVYLYVPLKLHVAFSKGGTTFGISGAPTAAYRINKLFAVKLGLPISKTFVSGSKVGIGITLGAGVTF